MKDHEFSKSTLIGEMGEKRIMEFVKSLSFIEDIKDVSKDKQFQSLDIDLVAKLKDNSIKSIEIKTDTYDTGNLFYETMSCVETNSIGCMEKTEADLIFYYFIKTKELYILRTKELRKWFHNKKYNFQIKTLNNWRYDNSKYTSKGYAIPKRYLEGAFEHYQKYVI